MIDRIGYCPIIKTRFCVINYKVTYTNSSRDWNELKGD